MKSRRIAVDAMGADLGVAEVAAGAVAAASEGIPVRLVGREDEVRAALSGRGRLDDRQSAGGQSSGALSGDVRPDDRQSGMGQPGVGQPDVEVVSASQVVTGEEEPARAVRSKQDASVAVGARAVAAGECGALVSAGSTGATLAASVFNLKRMRGVYRPALAVLLPVPGHPTLLIDAGANVTVRSDHLVQFAYMGAAFSEGVLGVKSPRVSLLSVGEEESKGTPDVVEAHAVLSGSRLNFIGNVEGHDLTAGAADVVVTDGFTGNVALKLMEGTVRTVVGAIRAAARSGVLSRVGGLMLKPKLGALKQELDPNTTGGAVLLGLNAVVVVAHGSSNRTGIANAIRMADRAVQECVVDRTAAELERGGALRRATSETPDSVLSGR